MGGKITARDLEFQHKFKMNKRQKALKALHSYAKSLTGSDKMHPPIIMQDYSTSSKDDKKAEKKEEKVKISAKQQEILDKQNKEKEDKIKLHDAAQLKEWEPKAEALGDLIDLDKLEANLLDLMLGYNRITDSFVGIRTVSDSFKTSEVQAKLVVKVVKAVNKSLKKIQLDKLPALKQEKARSVCVYLFCLVMEAFNSYGKKDIDGKGIKLFQETLISIGFPKTAKRIFNQWLEYQRAAAAPAAEPDKKDGGKDDKKKGKDDKKDKKDDKKDKKDDKKDKKDKKDGKDDKAADDKDPASFQVTKDVDMLWSGAGKDEFAFQLMHMGRYMARGGSNAKDPLNRVMFKPDNWQKRLLDIVDAEESALIVAPTASGKTFIGYYVMDKVLRTSNDGIAVYVAPSKALVNQVSAEIYARFSSKTYPPHCNNELLGVFLREYNSASGVMEAGRWKSCQILVTIPYVLELLLLAPGNQDWVKRLRFIIFDEVHTIGEGDGGSQLEHSLQMIPCPFIALSATVSDPSVFHGWLKDINKTKQQTNVEIVEHKERWNDLYKYIWASNELRPLHPFVCLIDPAVRTNGFASDLTLTPHEMAQLYLAVREVVGSVPVWDALAPATYFGAPSGEKKEFGFLTKMEVREYEKALKATFLQFMKEGKITPESFDKIVLALQKSPQLVIDDAKFSPPSRDPADAGQAGGDAEEYVDLTKLAKASTYMQPQTLMRLVKELDKRECLPAIVFNFKVNDIQKMLSKLLQELKDQQWHKNYGTEEASYRSKKIMERRTAEYNARKLAWEQAQKMKASKDQESKAARKEAKDDDDGGRGGGGGESVDVGMDQTLPEPVPPIDLADEIDPEFSFHSQKALGQGASEIEELLEELKFKKVPSHQIEALRRGIGMHHESCGTSYRYAVEILFRRGYLRVVFATGTLALGINMPCRSTIFCGDNLELNNLMYRQMSGRAGRRGFDLLGQVIFLDMSFLKVQRLVASDLSSLAGEFEMSSTSVLRALHMWERINIDRETGKPVPRNKDDIAKSLAPMFSQPFFTSESADIVKQVVYHTRFSLEFLYQEGLIGADGDTTGLANFVTHMFDCEPANIVLARLLTSGLLHDYLTAEKKKERKGDRRSHLSVKLAGVIGWLFYRKRLPAHLPTKRSRKKHLPSEHSPKLPPLPPAIFDEIVSYNKNVFEHWQNLVWAVSSTRKIGDSDFALPLSGRSFRVGWDPRGNPFNDDSKFAPFFVEQVIKYRSRSPFSAIEGIGDTYYTPSDLAKNVRTVLHLDLNAFPMVAPSMFGGDGLEESNSYILDFMIHGKTKYLWEDNSIKSTVAWKQVKEVCDVVRKASKAMSSFAPEKDIVKVTFERLGQELDAGLQGERGK